VGCVRRGVEGIEEEAEEEEAAAATAAAATLAVACISRVARKNCPWMTRQGDVEAKGACE